MSNSDFWLAALVVLAIGADLAWTFVVLEHRCPYCLSWFRHHETDTMTRCRTCKNWF